MALGVTLATYSVRVRPKGQPGEYIAFGDLDSGATMRKIIQKALTALGKAHHKSEEDRTVLHVSTLRNSNDAVWGILAGGEFGYEAEGISTETFTRTYVRQPDDAELIPFYFYFEVPAERSVGFLVVQRFGVHGIYSSLRGAIRQQCAALLPQYEVEFARLVPKGLIEDYLSGELTKITIRWYEVPGDVADRLQLGGNRRKEAEFHEVIRAKRGKLLEEPSWVSAWRMGRATIVELPFDESGERPEVLLGYTVEGKQRTLNPMKLEAMAPYHDVSALIKRGSGGHPTFESIHSVAQDYCVDLRVKLGIADDA